MWLVKVDASAQDRALCTGKAVHPWALQWSLMEEPCGQQKNNSKDIIVLKKYIYNKDHGIQ